MTDPREIEDAREALEFWSGRAERLPWHRRGARREARVMAARWRTRLIAMRLERWHLAWLTPFVAPALDTRGRTPAAHARRLAFTSLRRTRIGQTLVLVTATFALLATLCTVSLVVIAAHLAGL
jgi:hypothetical protein